jgi:CBS domain-containing protein/acyl dehydratase
MKNNIPFMFRIAVEDVMQSPVVTISPDATAREAARKLSSHEIGSLVVSEGENPVGIITDVDVTASVAAGHDLDTLTVEEFMVTPLVSIDPDAPLVAAARRLREHTIKRLPVVAEDGTLIGIVTTTDLSNFIPHLSHLKREQPAPADTRQLDVRPDTAYEDDDWSHEYEGANEHIDVGDVARFSKALSETDVEQFADVSGDTNRLHLEEAYASGTMFGRRIVHGTLVAGTISASLARLPGLTIYLSQELTFIGPVDIGDRVTATCEVLEHLGKQKYRLSTNVAVDGEDVIDGEAVVLSEPLPETA